MATVDSSEVAVIVVIKARPDSGRYSDICKVFRIITPVFSLSQITCISWLPSRQGNMCNLNILIDDVISIMVFVIRDQFGHFVVGIKRTYVPKYFLKCLLQSLFEIKGLNIHIQCLCALHDDISLLFRDKFVDWEVYRVKRQIIEQLKGVDIFHVSHSLNRHGDVLSYCQ